MRVTELKQFLKENRFHKYQKEPKIKLQELVDEFRNSRKVPSKYMRKQFNKQPCSTNNACRSKYCYQGVCETNPSKKLSLKPLIVKPKLELNREDKLKRTCYNIEDLELRPHQRKVSKFMRNTKQKGILLMHNVGSGKTITSLVIAKCILSKYPKLKVVALTPSSVVKQFESELKMLKLSPEMTSRFDVYSHQMWLDRFEAEMVDAKNTVLIVDEAHKFKSEYKQHSNNKVSGKYVQLLNKAALQSFKIILLSATPIENDIKEIRNYLAMIENKDLNEYYEEIKGQFENIQDLTILENDYTGILKCKTSYHKNTNKNNFPQKITKNVRIKMSTAYFKAYTQVEQNLFEDEAIKKIFLKDHHDKMPDINKFYTGIRKSVNKIEVISPKLRWAINKIRTNPETKTLIYSNWLEFGVHTLTTEFDKLKIKYRIIEGDVNQNTRREIVKDFNEHKFNVLLITSAGAEGLDLKGTRTVIILEPFWHQSRIEQVVGRAVRYRSHIELPASDRNVTIYNLILIKPTNLGLENEKDSADEIMYKMSQNKCSIVDQFYQQMKLSSIEQVNDCK